MRYPAVEINTSIITHNVREIREESKQHGVELMGVTKGILAHPQVIQAYLDGGLSKMGDARIQNVKRIRDYGFLGEITLLRAPMVKEISDVVDFVDISLNTEMETLALLNEDAMRKGKRHKYIVMVDVGDRREGVLPEEVKAFVLTAQKYESLDFWGLGLNVGCFGGVLPTKENTGILVTLKEEIEREGIQVPVISGGSTCSLPLLYRGELPKEVTELRVGEGFLNGFDSVGDEPIPGAQQNAFKLYAQIIEIKKRPSIPKGTIGRDAFGYVPTFQDKGTRERAIAAVGKQDVILDAVRPDDSRVTIEGASSDHLILDITESEGAYKIGDVMRFSLGYGGILLAMTSPYVHKYIAKGQG